MKQLSLAMMAMTLMFTACKKISGEGPVITETRQIQNFAGVDLRASADVYFTQAAQYKVEVTAQQNILDVLETYVFNNRLVVKYKNNVNVKSHEPVMVVVHGPAMDFLRVSGSGNITTTNISQSAVMDMDVSGSGSITISDLVTGLVKANISGSGEMKINSGSANELDLKISGSGDMDFANLVVNKANTNTSGSGNIRLHATQELKVKISGSGDVYYKGNPLISTTISGSGQVKPI
ncbi:MAG: head GIN domain-containing protein [Flavisolibacter sp.]